MPRRSRFTTGMEAETWAVSKGAPLRGSGVPITSVTRGLVKFWLTASGVPSSIAHNLPLSAMSAAWHDKTGEALARLRDQTPETPATPSPTPATPAPAPVPTPNEEKPKMNLFAQPNPTPAPARDNNHEAKLRAIADLFAAPAMDEAAVLEIVTRHMGATISAATTSATEMARLTLADIVEEARSIVNGAPRALRIEVKGRVRDLPPAPRHPLFDALLTLVVCGREPGGLPVMLVGPAGSGKTTACQHVADAIGLPFYTNGALTGAHELTGYKDAAGQYHTTAFRQAFEHGGVYLMDELDRSDAAAVLALNSALANGFMAFPDQPEPVRAHPDFVPIVAANTYGRGADRLYVGANQLDAATLDRFATLAWDYDETLERSITGDDAWVAYVQAARKAASNLKVRHVISPRASMAGAVQRRAGLGFDMVAETLIWKGMDQEQRNRIVAAIPDNVARRAQAPVIMIAAE